jgi:hypothetical protein
MRNQTVLQPLCLALLTVGLYGCAPPLKSVTTYPIEDGHGEIKRLMVVATIPQFKAKGASHGMHEGAFETAFRSALDNCGIDIDFLFEEQLSTIADGAEAVRTFSPDALLALDKHYDEAEQRYSANVIVMATKKIAWRADIVMRNGAGRDEALAATIVDRLKSDAVLGPSCLKPDALQRAP